MTSAMRDHDIDVTDEAYLLHGDHISARRNAAAVLSRELGWLADVAPTKMTARRSDGVDPAL